MNELVNWLFGLESGAQILDVRLTFVVPLPPWILVFVFIAIVWHCRRMYRHELAESARWFRWLMTVIRVFTWCAVVFVVLQPHLEVDLLVEPKSNLAILIDDSTSMTLVDQQADPAYRDAVAAAVAGTSVGEAERRVATEATRSEIVERILNNERHALLEQLGENYALHFFRFSENVEIADPPADGEAVDLPEPSGHITQLGLAMRNVPNRLRGLPMAGIVAFTDGANNKGEDPELSARMLGRNKVPVFPVGVGAPQAVDVQIIEVDVPDLLFKDDEVSVRVTMQATGLDGFDLPVDLTMGEKQVGKGRAVAADGVFYKDIVIKPEEVGDLEFIASVPQQQDEHFIDNNVLKKRVRVIDSAIRILIVCDTPSWEYRYLKGFLDSDERIETKVFIRRGDLTRMPEIDEQYLNRFPSYDELKTRYDCIIFNNIGADYFRAQTLQNLQDYVAEEGGAIIMIASTKGTPGTFINTPIGEMMPVSLERINEEASLDLSDRFSRGFKLNLTREGRQHIITRLEPLPDENARLWTELPDQFWYYTGIRRLKPTATALVEHASARNSYGPIPLMAVHNFGRGQVLFIGFNTWRWRYRIGNRLTNRFWGQTIQYMGLPHLLGNMKRVNFLTEARDFIVGERIPLTARVLDVDFQPVDDASVELIATERETGAIDNFTLGRDTDKEGVFSGPIFLKEGTWEIQVVGLEDEETLVIDSKPPQYEFMQTAMQEESLKQIAEISGGRYVPIDEVGELPAYIRATTKRARTRLETDLWDTLTALLCIIIAATIEWVIRRRIDLP